MTNVERVSIDKLGKRLGEMLSTLAKSEARVISQVAADMPIRSEAAAKNHYDTVLGRISGDLFRSIEGFSRQEGYSWLIGLRDKMSYARYLEFGTRHIKARKFLSDPLKRTAKGLIKRILKRITWEQSLG